tara:strand:+ start:236 stop:1504 length:1269 start_codon:yes stop_codon:yes gene_type:complete
MKFNCIVVHYSEIALKGKNRSYFEKLLMNNCKTKLSSLAINSFQDMSQIVIESSTPEKAIPILEKIPGITYFSLAVKIPLTQEDMEKTIVSLLKQQYSTHLLMGGRSGICCAQEPLDMCKEEESCHQSINRWFLTNKKFETFKISTKRRKKESEFSSSKLNNELGQLVVDKFKKKAQMKNPDVDIKVELADKFAYISLEDIKGVGGFPTDQRQKVVALLSGGFDSPVAAFSLMKRGCEVILVHFQNKNTLTKAVQNKVEQIATQLSNFQIKTKLFIVPFEDIQKEIIKDVPANLRMLIYRRIMLKISSIIANKHKALFLVTGDSVSQVASQTLDNLRAVYEESPLPIFTPLIGMDKQEIIDLAKQIGTDELSALPYGDCCSYFVPEHPNLRASAEKLIEIESKLKIDLDKAEKDSQCLILLQ